MDTKRDKEKLIEDRKWRRYELWERVKTAQYSVFGTVVSLEVAGLTVYATLIKNKSDGEHILFLLTSLLLGISFSLLVYLINGERNLAYSKIRTGEIDHTEERKRNSLVIFQTREETLRWLLNTAISLSWFLILILLNLEFITSLFYKLLF